MPVKEVPAKTPNGKPGAKKAPLGIPTWGWIAAIGIGLVIGYLALKKSGSASASDSGTGTSPLGSNSGSGGGGASSQDSPPPIISTLTDPGTTTNPTTNPNTNPFTNPITNPTPPSGTFLNPGGEVQTLSAYSPVVNVPSAPGSDFLYPGVASHPQNTQSPYGGGFITANQALLNPATTPSNIKRPGFQL